MMTSCRGVRAYLKFHQEHSVTCHWLLIYSLERPILFLLHQFLLTVALLTTSVNESVYNYDCWWPMTQTWRVCHYVNIKVMHRDAGMEGRAVATPPPPSTLDTYIQTQVLPCVFIARNDKTLGQLMLLWLIKAIFDHSRQCQFLIWPKSDDEATTRQVHIYNSTFLASLVVTNTIFFFLAKNLPDLHSTSLCTLKISFVIPQNLQHKHQHTDTGSSLDHSTQLNNSCKRSYYTQRTRRNLMATKRVDIWTLELQIKSCWGKEEKKHLQ